MTTVLTYGTFDTLHYGHIKLLERARALGDRLVVGLSTDTFNTEKGKVAHFDYDTRKHFLGAIRYVDQVIPEQTWNQKLTDVQTYNVDIFTIGDDWRGEFDFLNGACKVVYMPRTPVISSTLIRNNVTSQDRDSA